MIGVMIDFLEQRRGSVKNPILTRCSAMSCQHNHVQREFCKTCYLCIYPGFITVELQAANLHHVVTLFRHHGTARTRLIIHQPHVSNVGILKPFDSNTDSFLLQVQLGDTLSLTEFA